MSNFKNRNVALVAVGVVACAAAGAAVAATKLHGTAPATLTTGKVFASSTGAGHRFDGPGRGGDELAAAATYLGTTQSNLLTQLQAGKTLAQIADATSGKSAAGLIDALVAHETTEVGAALSAGRITQAQHDQIVSGLKARFTALVNGTRPSGGFPPHDDHRI